MRPIILILFLSLFAFGCKSIKKAKSSATASVMMSTAVTSVDSSSVKEKDEVNEVEEETTTQSTVQTYAAIDSAGTIVLKPVFNSTTVTFTKKKKDSIKTKEVVTVDSIQDLKSEQSNSEEKALNKASESEQVIGQIADKLFPKWGKILASILVAVVPVLWGFWKKSKQS